MEIKEEHELQTVPQARNLHTFSLCMVLVIFTHRNFARIEMKSQPPKARVAWSLEGEVPDEKNQHKDNSEETPPAFTSQAGGSRTCRLPPPRNQARLAGLATARSTLCKRDLRERNLNLNFPFCSRCTLSSLNTEPCAPSRKLQTKTTGSRIIQSWLAQRGSLLAISYSESRAVWDWCGRLKLKAETFLDAPFPSSSASGGLASHPPCAGTATGPARHSPPPRLDGFSLSFLPLPLLSPGRGGCGAARRVAVAEDMEREARDGAGMLWCPCTIAHTVSNLFFNLSFLKVRTVASPPQFCC